MNGGLMSTKNREAAGERAFFGGRGEKSEEHVEIDGD
jgi:hypothetical protein